MLIRFDGSTVIVAGAARGIGQAIARRLRRDGARGHGLRPAGRELAAIAGRVEAAARSALPRSTSPMRPPSPRSCARPAARRCAGLCRGRHARPEAQAAGRGAAPRTSTPSSTPTSRAAFLFAQAVAPGMKQAGNGRIVTISSRAGLATSLTGIQSLCLGQARPDRPGASSSPRSSGRSASR